MSKKMCIVCGRVTDQTRCYTHRTKQARGYGTEHQKSRAAAIEQAPYCWKCFCPATKCKLQWHHVTELRGGRNPDADDRRQLLCIRCHNLVKER